ncbi:MAG: hypothetical protein Q8920_16155 [Bacillota bacterium]|nr:hypothetical protein [Bacillota bacterium]
MLVEIDKAILRHIEEHKAATIKQIQRIFYRQFNNEDGYTYARRKLRHLEEQEILKSYDNNITKQKVYYMDKKLSAHDLFRLDFYSMLIYIGAEIIEFKKPHYFNNTFNPDAFAAFGYGGLGYTVLLEVDWKHVSTSMGRMQMYEKLYREADWKKEFYGRFPRIVIMGVNPLMYSSKNFTVVRLGLNLADFDRVLLK